MTWTTADIPDLSGRTAVVTGGNGGLGLASAKALAGAGATVVIAARDQNRAADALRVIRAVHPVAELELVPLDLASLSSVRAAASMVLDRHECIDILMNNAGVMATPEQRTEDGFEFQFGINHLGHWALTGLLLPAIVRAESGRVVTVTSTAHHTGRPVDPDNPHLEGRYGPWKAYGQSKLANWHFAFGLQDRFARAGSRAIALTAHPGLTNSELQARSVEASGGGFGQRFFHVLTRRVGMSTSQGALSQLRAATDPAARGREFYGPRYGNSGPPVRRPVFRRLGMRSAIDTLWEVSERETGIQVEPSQALGAGSAAG